MNQKENLQIVNSFDAILNCSDIPLGLESDDYDIIYSYRFHQGKKEDMTI